MADSKKAKATTKKSPKKAKKKVPAKMGRPSKYKKGMAEEFLKYVEDGMEKIHAAHKIGIEYSTLLEWTRKHDDFAKVHKRAKEIIEARIIEKADAGELNPAWAMFRLKCQHRYIERDKKDSLDIRREELEAKKAGEINDDTKITVNITPEVKDV